MYSAIIAYDLVYNNIHSETIRNVFEIEEYKNIPLMIPRDDSKRINNNVS